jgi:hypothetical protein
LPLLRCNWWGLNRRAIGSNRGTVMLKTRLVLLRKLLGFVSLDLRSVKI